MIFEEELCKTLRSMGLGNAIEGPPPRSNEDSSELLMRFDTPESNPQNITTYQEFCQSALPVANSSTAISAPLSWDNWDQPFSPFVFPTPQLPTRQNPALSFDNINYKPVNNQENCKSCPASFENQSSQSLSQYTNTTTYQDSYTDPRTKTRPARTVPSFRPAPIMNLSKEFSTSALPSVQLSGAASENAGGLPASVFTSPQWEEGKKVSGPLPSQASQIAPYLCGRTGRSQSFLDPSLSPPPTSQRTRMTEYDDPQEGAALSPFVHNAWPDLNTAVKMTNEEINFPTPGDARRVVQSTDMIMEVIVDIIGKLKAMMKCHDPSHQPKAMANAQSALQGFQNIINFYKDCIYEMRPAVFTVSNMCVNYLTVAIRKPDRNVSALASLAGSIMCAVKTLLGLVSSSRKKLAQGQFNYRPT